MLSLLAALVLVCCFSFSSNAQVHTGPATQQTGDLLDPNASNWSGTYGTGYWGGSRNPGTTAGSIPNRLPNNTGFVWGGASNVISSTIAINQALSALGIQVDGFSYRWRVKNGNANIFTNQPGIDDFTVTVDVYKADGTIYESYLYDYSHSHNWTYHAGSETFTDPFLDPAYFGNIVISAQGSDSANWAGRYGPEFNVRNSSFMLDYSLNPCYINALHDPLCPGYATAFYQQQCTANPLYDPGCPGYAAAYLTQQCNSNSLYSTSCPGYATAYYNQQCSLNPLYDPNCPGYATAYFNQQCSLNALYNTQCPGYATALKNQQCTANPTSDPSCPDYYVAKCKADPLFDMGCVGYSTAYYNQQCGLDAQYDQACPGYVDISGNDGDVVVLDPVVDDVVNVEVPVVVTPEPEVVVEEIVIEEQIIEEVIEEVVIDDTQQEIVSDNPDLIEEEVVMIESIKEIDKVEAKAKKIKQIRQEIIESLADKMSTAASFGIQTEIQGRIIKVINYVPNFSSYGDNIIPDGIFEEEVNLKGGRNVDHQFARWFLNDPNFDKMEDLQYNLKGKTIWQK